MKKKIKLFESVNNIFDLERYVNEFISALPTMSRTAVDVSISHLHCVEDGVSSLMHYAKVEYFEGEQETERKDNIKQAS